MATKTTRVVAEIAAQVTGTDDLGDLAQQLSKIPDTTSTEVAARVTGAESIAGLTQDLGAIPATTGTRVDASVAGDDQVHGLSADLAALPPTTATRVSATVSGEQQVQGLSSDLARVDASTTASVKAIVSGDDQVDALVKKLANAPKSDTFTVTAVVKQTGQKGGLPEVGKEIDEVKGKAKGLATEGGAFAAQFLGPYSDSIGLFGDLGEQLANISDEAGENGAGGKLKALGKVGAGIGVAIVAGLAVDQITSAFAEISAAQAEVAGVTASLTQTLIDNGDAWDENAQRALIAQVSQTTAFKNLSAAGIDYGTIMDGLTGQADGMQKLAAAAIASGNKAAVESLKEAQGLSNTGANARKAAAAALDYAKKHKLLTDAQKQGLGIMDDTASALDDTGAAAAGAGKDIGTATTAAKGYNSQKIAPKDVAITANDTSAQRTFDAVRAQKLPAKSVPITANDTSARRTLKAFNATKVPPKEATISAHAEDTASAQRDIQDVADKHYEAKLHVKLVPDVITEGRWNVVITPGSRGVGTTGAPAGLGVTALGEGVAPTAGAFTVRPRSAGGATYNITIQGVVDKDSAARAIDSVLRGRARRISATQLGRRPL